MIARNQLSNWAVPAAVALSAILVYANSIANGFALDDYLIVQINPRVHDLSNLREIWLTPYWPWTGSDLGLYRPAAIFLYAVQWALGDGAAWVFHANNVLLHATASVLVFVLLRRLTGETAALVGAVIFAVHPVHTEAVANIVGQAEIVAAIAVLAACLIHSGRPPGVEVSWPRRLLLIPLFLLALSTKESTVVLPGLLVLMDFAQRRVRLTVRGAASYADAMLMPLFLLAAALAAYLLVRFDVMGGSVMGVDAAPAMPYLREEHRVLNALRAFPEFIRLLFFPQELAADYLPAVLMPVEEVRPMVVLGAALLLGLTVMALLTPWLPAVGFPAAWFLLGILTVSNLFFPIGVLVAERTLYLPSIALSAAIAYAWHAAAPAASPAMRRLAPAAVVIAVVLMSVRTWIRNPDWKDTPAVYRALVRDHPISYRAQWVQAMALRRQGDAEAAEAHFQMAYRIYPRDFQFLAEYGEFLLAHGRTAEAVTLLEESFEIQPRYEKIIVLLSQAYLVLGRPADALRVLRNGDSIGIVESTAALRAYAYYAMGEYDAAVGASRVAARYPRMTWQIWGYLARNLAIGGFDGEALALVDSARRVTADPAARAVLDRVETAVTEGCYRATAASGATAHGHCDPLGARFELGTAAQNATGLQNASTASLDSLPPEDDQSR